MKTTKPVCKKSNKFTMYKIIRDTYHSQRTGSFLHYATILPHGKDPDWREKVSFWNE